jgi:hypothetical protein
MLLIGGQVGGTELTGTLYEPGEEAPDFRGAPAADADYVWVCDECYEVESGGARQQIGDRELRVAFESPVPKGFESREAAIEAADEHLRTQFARLGVPESSVEVVLRSVESPSGDAPA